MFYVTLHLLVAVQFGDAFVMNSVMHWRESTKLRNFFSASLFLLHAQLMFNVLWVTIENLEIYYHFHFCANASNSEPLTLISLNWCRRYLQWAHAKIINSYSRHLCVKLMFCWFWFTGKKLTCTLNYIV